MHAPYRLKRYRFFEIGQDHYYYDDMQTEEQVNWLVNTSYMPLCTTIRDMVKISGGKFHCALSISGLMLELFENFAPEMIDMLKELADTKAVEFVATPYANSLAAEYDEDEWELQLKQDVAKLHDLFGVKATTLWNTELTYSDELAFHMQKMGFKAAMTEGAKHVLSWKSPNYVYTSAASKSLKVLMRNTPLSDELSFHFSDPAWYNFPMDAEKFAHQIASIEGEEPIVNIWVGAETFGIRQNAGTGIFEFLKALPFYCLEKGIGFMTPAEAAKKIEAADTVCVGHTISWCGEAKDLAAFVGNDLQYEAVSKLYAVGERVRLCQDKALRRDWYILQSDDHFRFMNHLDAAGTNYESAYDAFINYMNVLSDFLLRVDEQYPTNIDNEELNELLKTINNQEKEIAALEAEVKKLKKPAKVAQPKAEVAKEEKPAKAEKPAAKKAPAKKAAKK